MRRWSTAEQIGFMVGVLGAAGVCFGMLWWAPRLADGLMDDPVHWLIAMALIAGGICVWAVIGLVGALLTALTAR